MTELDAETLLEDCHLSRAWPYIIRNVSQTQLSIARHYGGIDYQGQQYFYNPQTDELIRHDVVKWLDKRRREMKRNQERNQKLNTTQMEIEY